MVRSHNANRHFRLLVHTEDDETYALRLEEASGRSQRDIRLVARSSAANTHRVQGSVMHALRTSGVSCTALHARRTVPVVLDESAGVRLALVFLATTRLQKFRRVDTIEHCIDRMSVEEAFYWYAKCTGE